MPFAERQRYSSKPLDTSERRNDNATRYNSFGVSYEELDRRKAKEKRDLQNMQLTIQQTLQTAAENNSWSFRLHKVFSWLIYFTSQNSKIWRSSSFRRRTLSRPATTKSTRLRSHCPSSHWLKASTTRSTCLLTQEIYLLATLPVSQPYIHYYI